MLPAHRGTAPLAGKVALVTGASGGIGRAIARRLSTDGAAVLVHYNSRREPAEALAAALSAAGQLALAAQADLTQPHEVARLFALAADRFDGVDIVRANSGVSAPRLPLAEVSDETFERTFSSNARATFFVLREAARHTRGGGRVIIFGSSTTILQPASVPMPPARPLRSC